MLSCLPHEVSDLLVYARALALRCEATERAPLIEHLLAHGYWHPNGFAKLRLPGSITLDTDARLHYWPDSPHNRAARYDVHSHRWQYSSVVLAGHLVVEDYAFATSEDGQSVRFLCSANSDGDYKLSSFDRGHLTLTARRVLAKNSSHFGNLRTIHRTYPNLNSDALTLMYEGPAEKKESEVFRDIDETLDSSMRYRKLTSADVENILVRFLTAMS